MMFNAVIDLSRHYAVTMVQTIRAPLPEHMLRLMRARLRIFDRGASRSGPQTRVYAGVRLVDRGVGVRKSETYDE